MHSPIAQEIKGFFDDYFSYVGPTESPRIYHRWSILACIGALLGRNINLPFGHWTIYPNIFVILMGSPGARKDTAIKTAAKILEGIGYDYFSADRSSKERLLIDLLHSLHIEEEEELEELVLEEQVAQQFICIGEFVDFVGKNNSEFLVMLTKLWDCPPVYKHPKINSKSIYVPHPTVSILGGGTPSGYALNMPPEVVGSGFLSRLIHVHGEPTGIKITMPPPPSKEAQEKLLLRFNRLALLRGDVTVSPGAMEILDQMYKKYPEIEDYRFKYYNTRRFTHLLKLCMILAAARVSTTIEVEDCLAANTLLHYAEVRMPKALGEFGQARNSMIANAVIEIMTAAKVPVTAKYLWKQVQQDLNRFEELQELLRNLSAANKIQMVSVGDKSGYVPRTEFKTDWDSSLLWPELLDKQELV